MESLAPLPIFILEDCGADPNDPNEPPVEVWRGTRDDFLSTNAEGLDASERTEIRSLEVGGSFLSGGGSAPFFRLRRVS